MNKPRRNLIGAGLAAPLLGGCFFGDDVFIEWDEEVLLHDKTTMMVHLKHRWQRLSRGFTPKGGNFILRDSWLTFDAGGATGKVTQFFKGFDPRFIGQWEGVWYVWLKGGPYHQSDLRPDQKWRLSREHSGAFAKLVDGKFVAHAHQEFPKIFTHTNFFRVTVQPDKLFVLDKQRLTLAKKQEWPDSFHTYGYEIHNYR
jgi:hypothetical protein